MTASKATAKMAESPARKVLFSADDFGLSFEVNEAIEKAHREGVLSTASLMIAGPATQDALKRLKHLPNLNVGLHLVVIEGESLLNLPEITDKKGWFGDNGVKLGFEYFFKHSARKALKKEIQAQFQAFAKTGLRFDHANGHKHMHLHPLVGKYLIETGKEYGLKAVRVPNEPLSILGVKPRFSASALQYWTKLLRYKLKQAGMKTTDYCFGIEWSGHFTKERLNFLIPRLPFGNSEIYFHPAIGKNTRMKNLMPTYQPEEELNALLDPKIPPLLEENKICQITWKTLKI